MPMPGVKFSETVPLGTLHSSLWSKADGLVFLYPGVSQHMGALKGNHKETTLKGSPTLRILISETYQHLCSRCPRFLLPLLRLVDKWLFFFLLVLSRPTKSRMSPLVDPTCSNWVQTLWRAPACPHCPSQRAPAF